MKHEWENEELLMRYLLGELSDDEQRRLEEQYFADDELYYEIRALERDLIDSYARGGLTESQRRRCEARFSASPRWQREVELARLFYSQTGDAPAVHAGQSGSVRPRFAWLWPQPTALRYGAWALMLTLAIGGSWLLFEALRRDRPAGQAEASLADQRQAGEPQPDHEGDKRRPPIQQPEGERRAETPTRKRVASNPAKARLYSNLSASELIRRSAEMLDETTILNSGYAAREGRSEMTLDLISPVGSSVLEDRPTLRWYPHDGASGYQVFFLDEEAPASDLLARTEWKVERTLARGEAYKWYVVALRDRQVVAASNTATFYLISQAQADEIERAKSRLAQSPIELGIRYLQAGLLDDAEREFHKVVYFDP